ncbi:ribonuclease PH [Aeoliella sp. ICT_H6.2]|uniref:Ribonuclease PH n=1 Tax=Aeoliella straminimaris TaxID=2954799 RepID=A0A9X2F593_9BACT|nr:ribonuclease PH [Aeoliella straminimaris]MCO6042455.1 ribonuclease PH [Aeoliella straminimaris]
MPTRNDGRTADELRPVMFQRGFAANAPGSVLVSAGNTVVLCTASVSDDVPPWMAGKGKGWVTAEYNMLPGSTSPRKPRDRKKVDGRTTEIQRLIGRSLRAVVDQQRLGERMVTVDCDVLKADGGTRTASITGAYVALYDALLSCEDLSPEGTWPLVDSVAAVSAGVVGGRVLLDLDYSEDSAAEVDMNVVMTGSGKFIEVQGTGEGGTFTGEELQGLLRAAEAGIQQLTEKQQQSLNGA